MTSRRLALVGHSLPPMATVLTEVICRLFHGLSDFQFCLIRSGHPPPTSHGVDARCTFDGPAVDVPRSPLWRVSGSRKDRLLAIGKVASAPLAVRSLARSIAEITTRERCGTVITFSGDLLNLPAAALGCTKTGATFVPLLVDDYVYQWRLPVHRWLAKQWAARLFGPGQRVIVPNEFLADAMSRRYPVEPTIIRNPCDLPPVPPTTPDLPEDPRDHIEIAFTGSVYSAHYDSFRRLLQVLDGETARPARLHLYSNQTPRDLEQVGLEGPLVHHGFIPGSEIPEALRRAHILLLSLGFHTPAPEIVRTASPGKMGSYLASGTPILVHAPADSFVSWYCRHHRCALVVDEPDPTRLADAIRRLSTDTTLRQDLSRNAYQRAAEDFAVDRVRERLIRALEAAP